MEKLIAISESNFELLNNKLNMLIKLLEKGKGSVFDGWVTEFEAQKLLGLKTTTLWQMRKEGKIGYSKINGKTYDQLNSLQDQLKKNTVQAYH